MSQATDKIRATVDRFIQTPALKEACYRVIDHPMFAKSPGSAAKHHSYLGGLANHTLEVLEYAIGLALMMPEADREVVVTAAVFHDFMKVHEYDYIYGSESGNLASVRHTDYRKLVRHVAGSFAEFVRFTVDTDEYQLPTDKRLKIEHSILAHHGRKEWGSPVEPLIVEAYIIHTADYLSANFGPTAKRK